MGKNSSTGLDQRINKLLEILALTEYMMSKELGYDTNSSIRGIRQGKDARASTLKRIVLRFNVNGHWLLTGKGEMFLSGEKPSRKEQGGKQTFDEIIRGQDQELKNQADELDLKDDEIKELTKDKSKLQTEVIQLLKDKQDLKEQLDKCQQTLQLQPHEH